MKIKKNIIISLIVIIIIAILVAIIKPIYDTYVFQNLNKNELIQSIQNIKNVEERNQKIQNAVEKGFLTQNDVNKINNHYK